MTRRRRQKFEHCSSKGSFRKTSLQVWKLVHLSLSLSVYQPPNTHLLRGEPLFPSKLLNRKTVKALHREKTSLLRLFFMQFGGGIIGGCGLVNMQPGGESGGGLNFLLAGGLLPIPYPPPGGWKTEDFYTLDIGKLRFLLTVGKSRSKSTCKFVCI